MTNENADFGSSNDESLRRPGPAEASSDQQRGAQTSARNSHTRPQGHKRRTDHCALAEAWVVLENGPLDGTRMVDVNWEGKTVMIFTADLRERGVL